MTTPESQAVPSPLETKTMKMVLWRLMPFIMLCYFVAYLDRTNIAVAKLEMLPALGFNEAIYGAGFGMFYLGYCVFEIPSNLLLFKFGARRWIARIMVTWGLCAGACAFISTEWSFYIVRTLFGMAEAGFQPGVLFLVTLWFPETYRARVFGLFFAAIPISGIIGNPLSGALLQLNGLFGLHGWQWLFIIEALPAIILAPIVLIYLQDGPKDAKWLPDENREWLARRLASENKVLESKKVYSVLEALTNPLVLLFGVIYFTNVCLNNAFAAFLPTIIKSFGLTSSQSGYVAAVPSVVALVAVIWFGRRSDKARNRYGYAAFANLVGGAALIGSVLVADPIARIALLSIAISATLSFAGVFWVLPGTFLTGKSAAGGLAAISSIGIVGGYVAPFIIGYIKDITGTVTIGYEIFGSVAILAAIVLYLIGRHQTTLNVSHAKVIG